MVVMTRNDDNGTWGAADGTNELSCPDNPIKYLHLPSHDMDKEKQTINEKLKCLR